MNENKIIARFIIPTLSLIRILTLDLLYILRVKWQEVHSDRKSAQQEMVRQKNENINLNSI